MRIGVLGGGQLGRMIALAGIPLGHTFRFLDSSAHCCAGHVAPVIAADFSDKEALTELARCSDIITYEFENVPVESARFLETLVPVFPPVRALEVSQDRFVEKRFFNQLGISTALYLEIESQRFTAQSERDLQKELEKLGLPLVLKTSRMGYDGKGQMIVREWRQMPEALTLVRSQDVIAEKLINFTRELSIIAVRSSNGQIGFYPLVQNEHEGGILRTSRAPAPHLTSPLQAKAEQYARQVLEALQYVGVLAIEFFDCGAAGLLANEMAPRVHNSGHWTIEGAVVSQFENHVRAITGAPLGSTLACGTSRMVNMVGDYPDIQALLADPQAHVHLYGKSPRAGRKIGHVNFVGRS